MSSATTLSNMFSIAPAFEGIGLENWDVSNVVSMASLFFLALPSTETLETGMSPMLRIWQILSAAPKSLQEMGWKTGMCPKFRTSMGRFRAIRLLRRICRAGIHHLRRTFEQMFANTAVFNSDLQNWNVARGENFRAHVLVTLDSLTATFRPGMSLQVQISNQCSPGPQASTKTFHPGMSLQVQISDICSPGPQVSTKTSAPGALCLLGRIRHNGRGHVCGKQCSVRVHRGSGAQRQSAGAVLCGMLTSLCFMSDRSCTACPAG